MAVNPDGTVTLRTTGKVSSSPSGSGTGIVRSSAAKLSTRGSVVVPVKGRKGGPKSARSR